jgi:hypothetical protein
MDKFWIIPLIAFIIGGMMGAQGIYMKYTISIPNGIIELEEIKEMNCIEITQRNSLGSYWTPSNGKFARAIVDNCKVLATDERTILNAVSYDELVSMLSHGHEFMSIGNEKFANKQLEIFRKEACLEYSKTNIWNDATTTCDLLNPPTGPRTFN